MDYKLLTGSADKALDQLEFFIQEEGTSEALESIRAQMIFIRDNSQAGKNPARELPGGKKFTYGIIASREFASPRELDLKEYINIVSRILDSDYSNEIVN